MLDMFMHSIWNRSFAQKLLNFEVIQLVLSTPGFLRTSMATTMASWLDLWLSTCLGLLSFAVSTKTLRSEVGNQQKRTVWSSEACRVCCRTVWQQVEQFVGTGWPLATGSWQVQDSNDFEDSPQVVPTPEPAGFQLSLVAAREGYAWGAAFTDYLEAWKVDLGVGFVVDVKVDVSGISGLLSLAFISFLCLGTRYIYIHIS